MKRFRHVPTGKIFTKSPSDYACYPEGESPSLSICSGIPYYLVVHSLDWEEIKDENRMKFYDLLCAKEEIKDLENRLKAVELYCLNEMKKKNTLL